MTDREKIISAFEKAKKQSVEYSQEYILVPLKEADMVIDLLKDQEDLGAELTNAVELIRKKNKQIKDLKEQEAVKPHYNPRSNWYECGACHYSMTSGMHCKNELIPAYKVGFCAKCGKAVKWDDI